MSTKLRTIEVMLSSRVDDPKGKLPGGTKLRTVRDKLTQDLEAKLFTDDDLFSVFVNEGEAAQSAELTIEQHCRREVDKSDIVLILYNGRAGWAAEGLEGICHTEMRVAIDRAPWKVRVIRLPMVASKDKLDLRFQEYYDTQKPWESPEVDTYEGILEQSQRALRDAVGEMVHERARAGSTRLAVGRGEALQWRRLDFRARAERMRDTAAEALIASREGQERDSGDGPPLVEIHYNGARLLVRVDAIPGAMGVAAAREMVGQPFLRDHLLAPYLEDGAVGPVHVIACQAGVTESQAARQLGSPDATIVPTDFGVYLADEVQKVQMLFLSNCISSSAIDNAVQNMLVWLTRSAEGDALVKRAEARQQIVTLLAKLGETS